MCIIQNVLYKTKKLSFIFTKIYFQVDKSINLLITNAQGLKQEISHYSFKCHFIKLDRQSFGILGKSYKC